MDGFSDLVSDILQVNGVPEEWIHSGTQLELPGYFRPEKKWDLVVTGNGKLLAVMEFKSQVGSFGNNLNNRTEEAIGSATDLRRAYQAGAVGTDPPWLGYLMLLQKVEESTTPVKAMEANFKILPEFKGASYAKRYEILCERLVSEKLYDASCFLLSEGILGSKVHVEEPSPKSSFAQLVTALLAHVVPRIAHRTNQTRLR